MMKPILQNSNYKIELVTGFEDILWLVNNLRIGLGA